MSSREWLARKRINFYVGALAAALLTDDRDMERLARRELRDARRDLRRATHAA
jgi:hypothetical protein